MHQTPATPDQLADGIWACPPRLIPTELPDSDELLLIVALRPPPRPRLRSPAAVPLLPQLYEFAMWDADHLPIPHTRNVVVRRGKASLILQINGQTWSSCSAPPGPQWARATSCLVGVADGISHLRGSKAAHAFTTRLACQQAVIASARIEGSPFTVHIGRIVGVRETLVTTEG
jgi:hypothetical protein